MKTHDLSGKVWGHNYNIMSIQDGGMILELSVWTQNSVKMGDYLILRSPGNNTTRYQVSKLKRISDPNDMYFITATFAPRTEEEKQ